MVNQKSNHLIMNWIKKIVNKLRHSYYGIGKVLAFVVAALLVWWQMPRTGKFKYEFQLAKPMATRDTLRAFRLSHLQGR